MLPSCSDGAWVVCPDHVGDRMHVALYGSARFLCLLYPRLVLILGSHPNDIATSFQYYRFPVSPFCLEWKKLSPQLVQDLLGPASRRTFSDVHVEVGDSR